MASDADALEARGDVIVAAIERIAAGGARIAIFPENAMASPHKRDVSRSAPEKRDHHIAVIVGAVHYLGAGKRHDNCL